MCPHLLLHAVLGGVRGGGGGQADLSYSDFLVSLNAAERSSERQRKERRIPRLKESAVRDKLSASLLSCVRQLTLPAVASQVCIQ
jgi:hypothetical protein